VNAHPAEPADELEFTGERLIIEPGRAWFWERIAAEHVTRYLFAVKRIAGLRVLDAACGTGYGSSILARAAASVTGVDNDPTTIAFASRRWGSASTAFVMADVQRLPFAGGSFDAIVSFETIEHVPDPERFLSECARVLVAGGRLVISTPSRDVYNWISFPDGHGNPFHPSEMTPAEFAAALRRGFRIDEMYGQIHVPGYGGSVGEGTRGASTRTPIARLARSGIKRSTSAILSRPEIAARVVRLLRPGFEPRPWDERPWKYVIAVCTRGGS
jgi:SAM-dependent methyltransferase